MGSDWNTILAYQKFVLEIQSRIDKWIWRQEQTADQCELQAVADGGAEILAKTIARIMRQSSASCVMRVLFQFEQRKTSEFNYCTADIKDAYNDTFEDQPITQTLLEKELKKLHDVKLWIK
jgi:hypothetical protein